MRATRLWAIVLRQLYLMRGSPSRVLPLFAWVAVDMVLWGFITRYLNAVSGAGFDFVPVLLGAVLFWDFFTRVMQGVTTTFFEDVWSRNFLNLFATPLTVSEYVGGLVVASFLGSLVGLVIMVALASIAFGFSFLAYGPMLIPFLLVLFLFGIALGIFSAGVVLRLGPASEWLIWPVPALLSPFAGVFYPLATLPAPMRALAYGLPPTYVFEAMRAFVAGGRPGAGSLIGALALAAAYIALAFLFFQRVHRNAVRSGLIARYSAESVS